MGAFNGPQSCVLRSCLGINFQKNMVLTPAYAETQMRPTFVSSFHLVKTDLEMSEN